MRSANVSPPSRLRPCGDALVKACADEARCAATTLGARDPILLGFPDRKLGDYLGDRRLAAPLWPHLAKGSSESHRLRTLPTRQPTQWRHELIHPHALEQIAFGSRQAC